MSESSIRKTLRFDPEQGTIALIDPQAKADKGRFEPVVPALIVDEALEGCGLVVVKRQHSLQEADRCLVKVAELDPLLAEVRWIEDLDDDVQKIGLMYLE